MLTLKDLDNRVYSGKTCSEFSYSLKDEKGQTKLKEDRNRMNGECVLC